MVYLLSVLSVVPWKRIDDHGFLALIDFISVSIWLFRLLDLSFSHLLCPNELFLFLVFILVYLSILSRLLA